MHSPDDATFGHSAVDETNALYSGRGAVLYDLATLDDRSELRELLRALGRRPGNVLEFAAGAGRLTFAVARVADRVTAVDTSPELLHLLRTRLDAKDVHTVDTVLGDIRSFSRPEHFDAVVLGTSTITLFSQEDRVRLMDNAHRHLRAGGRFIVTLYEGTNSLAPIVLAGGRVTVEEQLDLCSGTRRSIVTERDSGGDALSRYVGTTQCLTFNKLTEEMLTAGFRLLQMIEIPTPADRPGTRHHLLIAIRGRS